ncbi:GSY2-interacting protein Pig2p [Monosporozyma servazzii]
MYIKAENKNANRHKENLELINDNYSDSASNNNNNNNINNNDSTTPTKKIAPVSRLPLRKNIKNSFQSGVIGDSITSNPSAATKSEQIYSLNFLHKPQRVKQFKNERFPEDLLQRNTDLNKQITVELPALSPTATLAVGKDAFNNLHYKLNSLNGFNSSSNNNSAINLPNASTDSLLGFSPPVYKKSGELVKSSLKVRSKSLPSTPAAIIHTNPTESRPTMLLRSKSVHFDQRAPVKYFISDESPMNVYSKDEFEDLLKYSLLNNPQNLERLARFTNNPDCENGEEDDEEDILFKFGDLLLEEKRALLRKALLNKDLINQEKATKPTNSSEPEDKPLRKSKRFQDIASNQKKAREEGIKKKNEPKEIDINSALKAKINKIPSETKISFNPTDIPNDDMSHTNNSIKQITNTRAPQRTLNKIRTNKVVGLYNQNFPILSNKNPKSLKLNIFVNLSRDKKVFLQEISLHVHQRKFSSPNFNSVGSMASTTRYIIGKVMVKNIFYDKRVTLRYTWNKWNTVNEVECLWLSNGDSVLPGTNMDVFHFLIDDTNKIDTVGKLEFCIHYVTRNDQERQEFWDNNDDKNYNLEVVMNGFNDPFSL